MEGVETRPDGDSQNLLRNNSAESHSLETITGNEESKKMVKTFQAYLPPTNRTYSCVHCRAHLACKLRLADLDQNKFFGIETLFNGF